MAQSTLTLIKDAVGLVPNIVCRQCGKTATSRKRLRVHVRQHWVNYFCSCGLSSAWRENIKKHQVNATTQCLPGCVYEVDEASFQRWKEVLGIHVADFPATRFCLTNQDNHHLETAEEIAFSADATGSTEPSLTITVLQPSASATSTLQTCTAAFTQMPVLATTSSNVNLYQSGTVVNDSNVLDIPPKIESMSSIEEHEFHQAPPSSTDETANYEDASSHAVSSATIGVKQKWLAQSTVTLIQDAVGSVPNSICRQCSKVTTTRKRLLVHARQHWVSFFCSCGMNSTWRENVTKHQASGTTQCQPGCVYEVDEASFQLWKEVTGVPVANFPSSRSRPMEEEKDLAETVEDLDADNVTDLPVISATTLPASNSSTMSPQTYSAALPRKLDFATTSSNANSNQSEFAMAEGQFHLHSQLRSRDNISHNTNNNNLASRERDRSPRPHASYIQRQETRAILQMEETVDQMQRQLDDMNRITASYENGLQNLRSQIRIFRTYRTQ